MQYAVNMCGEREREREQAEGRAEVGASSIFVSHHHTDRQTDIQTYRQADGQAQVGRLKCSDVFIFVSKNRQHFPTFLFHGMSVGVG